MGERDWVKTVREADGTTKAIPISLRERRFLIYYLHTYNVIESARKAGFKSKYGDEGLALLGREVLGQKYIKDIIETEALRASLSSESVLERLGAQASATIADFLVEEDLMIEMAVLLPDGSVQMGANGKPVTRLQQAFDSKGEPIRITRLNKEKFAKSGHLIKKLDIDGPRMKIELYDAQRALELIGKSEGLFTEKLDVTNHGDVVVKVVKGVTLEDI